MTLLSSPIDTPITFPQVAVILDVEHQSPWVQQHRPNTMDKDMPTGHLVVVQEQSNSGNYIVDPGCGPLWYVHPSSLELLGPL